MRVTERVVGWCGREGGGGSGGSSSEVEWRLKEGLTGGKLV